MFNVVVEIKAPEIVEAIRSLAAALTITGLKVVETVPSTETNAVINQQPDPEPSVESDKAEETPDETPGEKVKEDAAEETPDAETETETETETEEIPTVVELRAKAQEIGKTLEGKKAIKGLLDVFGSKSISDVPEDKRASFLHSLEAL